jgi:multidrug resistance efflux pump
MTSEMPRPDRSKPPQLAAPQATLLGALLLGLSSCGGEANQATGNANLYTVARGDLHITIKENAELQAVRETIVRSQVEGQATIIYLIAEGAYVQKDEKLVELDVSDLVEKRANQAISVAKAQAALAQAQKEKEILQKELLTNEGSARSGVLIAQMEVEKFLGRRDGGAESKNKDMVTKLSELVSTPPDVPEASEDGSAPAVGQVDPRSYRVLVGKVRDLLAEDNHPNGGLDRDMGDMANRVLRQVDVIRLAMANLKVKEDTLGHSRRLAAKQFITRNELERDQLEWQSQVSQVTLAWNELDLLINYELQKQLIELRQRRANAELELDRVLATNEAAVTRADSELASREAEYELARERLQNLEFQIRSAVVTAPGPGLVVYARLERNRRGGEAVREGVEVRERQELIILPDTTKMQCVIKVQEAQVSMVHPGQIAYVQAEALPGEVYSGRVTSVAPTADSNSGWMSSDRKVYTTIVELDGSNGDGKLRSRMAASVTINVDTIRDVLTVPLQGVFRDRSVNYVWLQTARGPEARRIEVSHHNSERVVITQGLVAGDVIHLTMPSGTKEPQFEQPALPEPAQPAPEPAAAPENGGADSPGVATAPGERGPGNRGPGGGNRKAYPEMTPDELQDSKQRLLAMVDRLRDQMEAEQATRLEKSVADIVKAIDENRLDEAQTLRDAMRSLMPRRPNGAQRPSGDREDRER